MRRHTLLLLIAPLLACSSDKKPDAPSTTSAAAAAMAAPVADTQKVDLSGVKAAIAPAVKDTFARAPKPLRIDKIPDAPDAVMAAVEREEGISRFCYQEFGQKVDPKLVGAVAMVVVVDVGKIWTARVGADDWSSPAGKGVNDCLVQKAPQAWKLLPGAKVAPGRYVVQLKFRPS